MADAVAALRKAVTIRLRDDVVDALDAEAEEFGRTRQEHAAELLQASLGAEVVDGAGHVERETRKDIEALVCAHPMGEALTAIALNLARTLDRGAGLASAGIAKELRTTLQELAKYEEVGADDDDAPDLGGPTMGDEEDSEPA